MEGFPMRSWNIEIWLLDESGQEVAANVFEKATYNLHPSFEKNKQSMYIRCMMTEFEFVLMKISFQEAPIQDPREGMG
jgi:hypothetical protein